MSRAPAAGRMAGSAKNQEADRSIVFRDQVVQDALTEAGDMEPVLIAGHHDRC